MGAKGQMVFVFKNKTGTPIAFFNFRTGANEEKVVKWHLDSSTNLFPNLVISRNLFSRDQISHRFLAFARKWSPNPARNQRMIMPRSIKNIVALPSNIPTPQQPK